MMPGSFPTLTQRKASKLSAIRDGLAKLEPVLSSYAREHGGRFLLFGSAARNDLRFDSDIDILVDFPLDSEGPARNFAEDECLKLGLPADVFSIAFAAPRLRARAQCEGRLLA